MLADVSEACMGAGILSTFNLAGGLQIIKTLKILPDFDFTKRKIHFSDSIGPDHATMKQLIEQYPKNYLNTYAEILDHSKLEGTRKEFAEWAAK